MENNNFKYGKSFNIYKFGRDFLWRRQISFEQERLSRSLKNKFLNSCTCPICYEEKYKNFVEVYGFAYKECNFCGHIYLGAIISDEALRALYDGEDVDSNIQNKIYTVENKNQRKKFISSPKLKFIEKTVLGSNSKSDTLWVDIGCGSGELLSELKDAGYKTLGIECDKKLCDIAKSNGIEVLNIFLDKDNASQLFSQSNVISMINILEHVVDPINFLNLISVNSSNPFICLEVPRHPSFASFSAKLYPHNAYRHIYPPDHIHVFTDMSLNKLLEKCNLKMIACWYFSQGVQEFIQAASMDVMKTENSLYQQIMNAAAKMEIVADKNGLADTMLVIAKKS